MKAIGTHVKKKCLINKYISINVYMYIYITYMLPLKYEFVLFHEISSYFIH